MAYLSLENVKRIAAANDLLEAPGVLSDGLVQVNRAAELINCIWRDLRHYHVAQPKGERVCASCGLDLVNPIHFRKEE